MNPYYLTKISKFALIASCSAFLSFASRNNPQAKQFFWLILGGIVVAFLLAALWEARDYLAAKEPTEEGLTTILSGLSSSQKPKRSYYLSTSARLEIVVALVTIVVFSLVGSL
jgi:ABC-type Fe3+-siderophore transport system permease subunit